MTEQINEQELNEIENEALDKMSHGLKEIWKIIIFCCVGWLMVCIGMKTNPIFAVIGALIVSIPSVISVRRYGFKNIFNYDYQIETTYSDGSKRYDADLGGKLGMLFIQLILTIFIGVVVTPIRYIAYCIKFNANCKKLDWKPEFKLGILFPTVVGVGTFIVGLILTSIL
ncbi:MAG: hypothetical protein E7521_02465 [Ruminococcaceae bacterium]|nr:hypothetical protein [Oscillospiraceae bacterium]